MTQEQLILNRYRPIAEAGSGGFATVQVAWDTRIQRRVAIKCLQLDDRDMARVAVPDEEWMRSFDPEAPSLAPRSLDHLPGIDEARTAAMLTDASIVGVYDFEVQGSTAYLIMEYVDGMTLSALMRHYGDTLSLDVLAAVFTSIAHALEVAHENQVLHLDIKPDNILINRQGQVKVTDFGLATLSDATGFGAAGGGTIGYMPLEQMRQESLDARCDEWALASLTYEMITGTNPFLAPDLVRAEKVIEDAELVLPSLCWDGIDAAIDDVLFFALDPDREERYDNVEDFSEEMTRFLGNSARGHKELAMLVGSACEDFEEEEEVAERISLFDRIGGRGKGIAVRVWAALNVAILGFVALSNIPPVEGFTSLLFWGLLALLVLAAVLKPHLGSLLGLSALGTALFFQEAIAVGFVLLAATVAWWFFVGRKGDEQADAALSPVLFGSFGFNQITPLCIGFFLSVKESLATTALAFFVSIVLASFGSNSLMGWNALAFWDFGALDVQSNMLILLQQPLTWCIAVSWLVASVALSLFCLRQTRLFSLFGVVVAFVVMLAGICFGSWIASGQLSWMPSLFLLVPTIGAGVVAGVACAFGVPIRAQENE